MQCKLNRKVSRKCEVRPGVEKSFDPAFWSGKVISDFIKPIYKQGSVTFGVVGSESRIGMA